MQVRHVSSSMLGDNKKGQRPRREGSIQTVQTRLKVGSKSISTLQLLQTNVGQCAANMWKVRGNKELRATTREQSQLYRRGWRLGQSCRRWRSDDPARGDAVFGVERNREEWITSKGVPATLLGPGGTDNWGWRWAILQIASRVHLWPNIMVESWRKEAEDLLHF